VIFQVKSLKAKNLVPIYANANGVWADADPCDPFINPMRNSLLTNTADSDHCVKLA
jgi:hypothetical protein